MKLNVFFILFLLTGIFFATYGLLVGSPFDASTLDFRAYFMGLLALSTDASDFPISRLAVMIVVLALANVAIWLVRHLLEA